MCNNANKSASTDTTTGQGWPAMPGSTFDPPPKYKSPHRHQHKHKHDPRPIDQPPTQTYTNLHQEALKELGEWASRYEMIAAMGYLALLLMVGKAVNNLGKAVKVRKCVFVCVS